MLILLIINQSGFRPRFLILSPRNSCCLQRWSSGWWWWQRGRVLLTIGGSQLHDVRHFEAESSFGREAAQRWRRTDSHFTSAPEGKQREGIRGNTPVIPGRKPSWVAPLAPLRSVWCWDAGGCGRMRGVCAEQPEMRLHQDRLQQKMAHREDSFSEGKLKPSQILEM